MLRDHYKNRDTLIDWLIDWLLITQCMCIAITFPVSVRSSGLDVRHVDDTVRLTVILRSAKRKRDDWSFVICFDVAWMRLQRQRNSSIDAWCNVVGSIAVNCPPTQLSLSPQWFRIIRRQFMIVVTSGHEQNLLQERERHMFGHPRRSRQDALYSSSIKGLT